MSGTASLKLDVVRPGQPVLSSPRVVEVCLRFGLVPEMAPVRIASGVSLALRPGTITLVTGPSGSGKSSVLAELARRCGRSRLVNRVAFPLDVAVVDAVAPGEPMTRSLAMLTACALGEPRVWIRQFDALSDGEKFRARLARAVSLHRRDGAGSVLLCDEFCEQLHRRVAKAIAYNLRKLVTRERLTLVVATGHEDLEKDLRPDQVLRLGCDGSSEVTSHRPQGRHISFFRRLRIEKGSVADYERFAPMHYRRRDKLGFVDKVFVLRDGIGGEALGIAVYAHSPLELSLRNRATGGRFVRNPARLNREMRILRRLVIHPDVRGCGLGHRLVRKTLPLVRKRYVECLAALGLVHPVFEKAGMRRIGVCPVSAGRAKVAEQLRRAQADPLSPDFISQVCRRPRVRRLVAQAVFEWYRAMTGDGEARVQRQSPNVLAQTFRQMIGSRPVYYLWCRDGDAGFARSRQEEVW